MAVSDESELGSDIDSSRDKKKAVSPQIDIITAVTLMTLCIFLFFHALSLPRPDNTWIRAPGGMLLLLAITLFFMALSLLLSAIKLNNIDKKKDKNNVIDNQQKTIKTIFSPFNIRQIVAIGITFFYVFVLVGRIYFEFSSIIYLFLIMKIFWKDGKLINIMLISIIAPIVFSVIFTVLFSQGLPGGSLVSDIIFFISRRGA